MKRTIAGGPVIYLLFLLLPLLWARPATSQTRPVGNVDEAFEQAQSLAYDGKYDQARGLARAILAEAPDYVDVRILIVRTYAWEERFEEAREVLQPVLEEHPDYRDAVLAKIDLEYWSGDPEAALEVAEDASRRSIRDGELLARRVELLIILDRHDEAATLLNQLEGIRSYRTEVRELRNRLSNDRVSNALQMYYTRDQFSEVFDPWNHVSFRYQRMTGSGPVLAHLNVADRFGDQAFQGVLEMYPRLGEMWYGYLQAGWSPGSVFPTWRLSGELYRTFESGWEVSAGARYLQFGTGDVVIISGSVSRFIGNWMITARPFFGTGDEGLSRAGNLMVRHYFGNPDTHLSLRVGMGFSPEERQLLPGLSSVDLMESRFGGVEFYKALNNSIQWMGEARLTRQEMQAAGGNVRVVTLVTGFSFRF